MNVLEIKNLSFDYGKNKILQNIFLASKQGSITAVLAPNGTGKTTLFHNILGILKPYEGSVFVKEKNILKLSPPLRATYVSYVPQEWVSPFNYSVPDIIMMGLTPKINLFGSPKVDDEKRAMALMEEIGVAHLKNRGINELSGGQRQMVLLGRALFQDCPLLLLDEPTSHLDIKNQALLFRQLKIQVKKKSLSVLINIHDPNLVSAYADEVYMFKDGKNFCNGRVNDVMNEENLSALYGIDVEVNLIKERPFIRAF
ncbi:hypothetical protein BKH41_08440 [Helicobacter sp. 12S02232-10]|uniref:ABC transporter ATP-binding protein n=1 Tax=Helicobacter sp. 12S02232-10 TaxID=1476197 RepID=UPI000BA5BF18|nr:ABC transporter ATP-binding protein [Helicobacter sp. 12S02232-10]PAF46887.1 hypothetical protein BKH41_08440 [Helicobacter sp. 12S02232-10]